MANYRLTEQAARDIDRLFDDGLEQFGTDQACTSLDDLHRYLEKTADNPKPGIHRIKEGLRRSVHHAHGIYFTVSHQGVVIVRVQGRPNFSAAVEE